MTYSDGSTRWLALGSFLRESEYTTRRIQELLGLDDPVEEIIANTGRYSLMFLDELATCDDPASILAEIFLFSGQVPVTKIDRLDPSLSSLIKGLGLIESVTGHPELVRGVVTITEYAGAYFLSDRLFENSSTNFVIYDGQERCMPPHTSSLELFKELRRPDGAHSLLDVGCGTGCQSILLASGYQRVFGFDTSRRSVELARINALLNNVTVQYAVDKWESFQCEDRYDHVIFNAPNSFTAFSFINSGLGKVLAKAGCAQVWLWCEVSADDGDLQGVLRREIQHPTRWHIDIAENLDSPFSLSSNSLLARRLPYGSLLAPHPSEHDAYLNALIDRRVVEVVSAVLTIRHATASSR
ncbi:class I SAM-dependent methyltransferase [Streptomyces sp. NPDC057092]|uniref:class I SAM-dependent methyltransferase n=1 Tax=Streptomyces sp. NPDC057092 TaxID=3346017 RepID=UPI00363C6E65